MAVDCKTQFIIRDFNIILTSKIYYFYYGNYYA